MLPIPIEPSPFGDLSTPFGGYSLWNGVAQTQTQPVMKLNQQVTSLPKAPEANPFLGIGALASVAGAAMGTAGAYFAAKNSKLAARSQASAADFQASIAARNARMAEIDAQTARDAGIAELRQSGWQYGQAAGRQRAQQAAAGVDMSSGNALEQRVSLRLAQRIDALTINRNTATAVSARQANAVNFRNQAAMARVTAGNLRATAGSISPGLSTFAGLLDAAARSAAPLYAWSRNRQNSVQSASSIIRESSNQRWRF